MKKAINGTMALAFICILAASCNQANKDKPAEIITGTDTSMMNKGSASADNQMTTTTSTTATDSMAMKKTEGAMAKPNLAKKGMKGKVSIVMAETAKGDNADMMDNEGYYTNIYPSFPGGQKALEKYFENNIQYPADASDNGVEGTVNINFAVDEKGKMSGAKIANAPIGYGLEDEAMRVFKKMPTWAAGSLKGKNVKTRYTLPVRFQLF